MSASMKPHLADPTVTVWHGDALELLATLDDASVDAVVTDPPYGIGFMGKAWDELPPGEEWAAECLRVLKPGGHLLTFGGTRTWHRLACAVEDAGFEVRDSIAWLYGSGFPKSLDVSKAIDKRRDDAADVRVVCRWLRARIDEHPTESTRTLAARFGFHPRMVEHWAARDTDSQPTLPTLDQWDALREAIGFADDLDAEVLRLNLRKGEPGEAWADRPVTGQIDEWKNRVNYALTSWDGLRRDIPATDDARTWQGWGTALKPAFEPIVVARKPLSGTVAANVLEHGTGALNIDGCRIGNGGQLSWTEPRGIGYMGGGSDAGTVPATSSTLGRWPANVILDESQAAALDEQSGTRRSSGIYDGDGSRTSDGQRSAYNIGTHRPGSMYADQGGASRFFYVTKAPASERIKIGGVAHPTVKPLELMRWLIRLVTPPGGTVLDPFAGSGTTIEAALLEGMRAVGIEREADYLALIEMRIARRRDPLRAIELADEDPGLFDPALNQEADQ